MKTLLTTNIGRLRILGFLEGTSLLLLICIAVPFKYILKNDSISETLGPIHGALFLLYVLNTISISIQQQWKFTVVTYKVLLACCIPFGTFYVDYKILQKIA